MPPCAQWIKHSDLAQHEAFLWDKIALTAVVELVFQCPTSEREVPFAVVARK